MDSQTILAYRRKWIGGMKLPTTVKGRGHLVEDPKTGARCCLGHACHILGAEYDDNLRSYDGRIDYAPPSIVEALGLWTSTGSVGDDTFSLEGPAGDRYNNLAELNDHTSITPQEIGAYLETVIMGGPATPFRPIEVAA